MKEENLVYYLKDMISKKSKVIQEKVKWFSYTHIQYMVRKKINLIDLEETFCSDILEGTTFTKGGHMKREPIDIYSIQKNIGNNRKIIHKNLAKNSKFFVYLLCK